MQRLLQPAVMTLVTAASLPASLELLLEVLALWLSVLGSTSAMHSGGFLYDPMSMVGAVKACMIDHSWRYATNASLWMGAGCILHVPAKFRLIIQPMLPLQETCRMG